MAPQCVTNSVVWHFTHRVIHLAQPRWSLTTRLGCERSRLAQCAKSVFYLFCYNLFRIEAYRRALSLCFHWMRNYGAGKPEFSLCGADQHKDLAHKQDDGQLMPVEVFGRFDDGLWHLLKLWKSTRNVPKVGSVVAQWFVFWTLSSSEMQNLRRKVWIICVYMSEFAANSC